MLTSLVVCGSLWLLHQFHRIPLEGDSNAIGPVKQDAQRSLRKAKSLDSVVHGIEDFIKHSFDHQCYIAWTSDGICNINGGIGCNPDGAHPCCSSWGFCDNSSEACTKGVDFRKPLPHDSKHLISENHIADYKLAELTAHPLVDEWFTEIDDAKYYTVRTHVSELKTRYDADIPSMEKFSEPVDEEDGNRPRCSALNGYQCKHFRCCSIDGLCGDSPEYCSEHSLQQEVERKLYSEKPNSATIEILKKPFDSSTDSVINGGSTPSEMSPFFCNSWWTLTTALHNAKAVVWVSGVPDHSYINRWEEHGGIPLEHLWYGRWNLIQQISADELQLRLADLRRSAASVLMRFASERNVRFDEILRVESWGTQTPSKGIIDAAFSAKLDNMNNERIILSFDFDINSDVTVFPKLKLLDPIVLQSTTQIVFVIASFGRKDNLQRLIRQINKIYERDGHHTTACVAGQSNDPEGISIRDQVYEVATFEPKVIEIDTMEAFNKARNLQVCIDSLDNGNIAFVMDVDLILPDDLPSKTRRYTRQGRLVYSPIIYYQPRPDISRAGDVMAFDHTKLPIAEKIKWAQLAQLGPGIIAFYVSDAARAGGFDTKTFADHGFEDTDFFFRLKRAGLNFARVEERGLIHIYHEPSANNNKRKANLSWKERWYALQKQKCSSLQSDRMLEWFEQSQRSGYRSNFFNEELPKPKPYKPPERPWKVNEGDPGPTYIFTQKLCDGSEFCMKVKTHMTIQLNTERLNAMCVAPLVQESPHSLLETRPPSHLRVIEFLKWNKPSQHGNIMTFFNEASTLISRWKSRDYDTPSSMGTSLRHAYVGAFSETLALFRAKIRCGEPFSLARYGDGEMELLKGVDYTTGIDPWQFQPSKHPIFARHVSEMMADGFQLAEEYDEMHLGLPFYFCAEGVHAAKHFMPTQGGGGNSRWLSNLGKYLGKRIPQRQLVYSWQWGNLNYASFVRLLNDIGKSRTPCIVVCGDSINGAYKSPDDLPSWIWSVLTVPENGLQSISTHLDEVKASATALARAVDGFIFLFAAGPISNVLIPLMTRANKANSYVDVGGSLDWELKKKKSRDFHPDKGTPLGQPGTNYIRAGGAISAGQTCTETRWELVAPRVHSTLTSQPCA